MQLADEEMVLLCFVVDISLLSFTALKAVKNFGNLYALRSSKRTGLASSPGNGIGLCYISINESSGTYELTVVQRASVAFNLRDFHHAVKSVPSSLFDRIKLESCGYSNQVSSLLTLLNTEDGLLSWGTQDAVKKVIMISSRFMESVATFKHALLKAADHFVGIEFIEIEQPEHCGSIPMQDEVAKRHDQLEVLQCRDEFAIHISEFENCTLRRVPFDPWTLMRLMKRWQQEIISDRDGPVEAVLLFPMALSTSTNKVFCSFQPAVMQLADVFKPCQICRCHGQPTESPVKPVPKSKVAAVCGVTGQKLGLQSLADNGIMIGKEIVLSMPSFKNPVVAAVTTTLGESGTSPIAFDVIKCISLTTLSEGLLFGLPYIVSPSSEVDIDVTDADNIEDNEQIFTALLQDLYSRDCGLLCTSTINIESGEETSFLCFYVLLPAQTGSFLAKRLAGAEEIMLVPESASGLNAYDLEVSDGLKCAVSSGLSQLGTETYNPLQRLRGCHSKLTCLVKESLQTARRGTGDIEKTALVRRAGINQHLREEELLSCNFSRNSGMEGTSMDSLLNVISPAPILPVTSSSGSPPSMPTGERNGIRSRQLTLQKHCPVTRQNGRKERAKAGDRTIFYPPIPKAATNHDPFSFSAEAGQGTKLPLTPAPLVPSKRFPGFTTARQQLLQS